MNPIDNIGTNLATSAMKVLAMSLSYEEAKALCADKEKLERVQQAMQRGAPKIVDEFFENIKDCSPDAINACFKIAVLDLAMLGVQAARIDTVTH